MDTMGSSLYFFILMHFFFFLSGSNFTKLAHSSSSLQQLCHDDESTALLQFKQSFFINKYASQYCSSAYPKVFSWSLEGENGNCCSWDGVECDNHTGHVIGLDLSCSLLYGSINSSSTLFKLVHLQNLDLSFNHFNYSQIPSEIRNLVHLQSLDLSASSFFGQIPSELLELPKLAFLNLYSNADDPFSRNLLKLEKPSLSNLVENLTNLQVLGLGGVNISSTVPETMANLSSLSVLYLRDCGLFGNFPSGIFSLPKLSFLSVQFNPNLTGYLPEFQHGSLMEDLRLANTNFTGKLPKSIGNLEYLKWLDMSNCQFSGQIPFSVGNLINLTYFNISTNHFIGQIPLSIGNLTNLIVLDLAANHFIGQIPFSVGNLINLSYFILAENHFIGQIPLSIGNLTNLTVLDLAANHFIGQIPFSVGNLINLSYFILAENHFIGQIPFSVGSLIKLTVLDLSENHLTGDQIPSSLANLTQLYFLSLAYNNFSSGTWSWIGKQTKLTYLHLRTNNLYGVIPSSLQNMTQLTLLDLSDNYLTGEIPSWLRNLTQLTYLYLQYNGLTGTMEINKFFMPKSPASLDLSGNKLSSLTMGSTNGTFPKFQTLVLSRCNLSNFPKFLQYQDQMELLDLSNNNIHGLIPKWFWNIGKTTLKIIKLQENFLTGFEQPRLVLPWLSLRDFVLSGNLLRGSLPIPPFSIVVYWISNNSLTGEIPPIFCKFSSLFILDLSDNNLNGTIPQCLSNFSDSLTVIRLQNNNFHGTIPQAYSESCNLKVIDLSQNHLDGPVPRSLANCKILEQLNLGNNQIDDAFPFWLGTIPQIKILVLRYNKFHGNIEGPLTNFDFPKLRIIDISWNSFSGELPVKYFQIWSDMKVQENITESNYAETIVEVRIGNYHCTLEYRYTMTITNKGAERFYKGIQSVFKAIDLSGNKFKGKIPESIGVLKGLRLLNLSNNALAGPLPTSLGNLTALESLDLSQNDLSGDIPQQLVQLTFLEVFNVSHNHLTGRIPRGNQFGTFENSSFDGNLGLCGEPLSKKCGNSVEIPSPTSTFKDEDSDFPSKLDWIIISLGYLSGTVVGVVIGHILTTRYHLWFVRKFGNQPKWRRAKKGGRRN